MILFSAYFLRVIFVGKNNGKQNDTKMLVSHKHFEFRIQHVKRGGRGSWNGRCQASGGRGGGCIGRISANHENEN